MEITRKITNNIINKYKTTIPHIKLIKNFLICDEEKIFYLDFSINEFKEREKDYLKSGGHFIVPCPKFEIISGKDV